MNSLDRDGEFEEKQTLCYGDVVVSPSLCKKILREEKGDLLQ